MHVCVCLYAYVCDCVCMWVYVCMYVYMCIQKSKGDSTKLHYQSSLLLLLGDMPSMPGDVKKEMYALSEVVHKFAFDIVFAPLQQQLTLVATMEVSHMTFSVHFSCKL